ncbi:tyrosine-type recombinase/integrase [Mesorhizobium sp. AaZ16]|uniref:tyrosine-type recombinase/integrase n=1 Tax=Mesorhizobium sp. AaZ16 TaxID=3402289 RepID=UPI00374EA3CF
MGEIAGIRAGELAYEGERLIWRLPTSRSKNKRERVTPMAGMAKEIAETALRGRPNGELFRTLDGKRSLRADDIGLALNHRARPIAHFTTHDLRRTVVSAMDEMGIALDTIAAVIGHQRGTGDTRTLIRHYSRPNLDHRVEAALTAWQVHLQAVIDGREKAGNVVRLTGDASLISTPWGTASDIGHGQSTTRGDPGPGSWTESTLRK